MRTNTSTSPSFSPSSLKFDLLIGTLLRIGVVTSVSLIVLGTLWHCLETGSPEPEYHLAAANLYQFLVDDFCHWTSGPLRPRLLVNSGLAVLLLTPYLRVLASVIYFSFVEKNLKFTLFTLFVLSALTYSLFLR